jgi:hypothetical protein
MVSIRKIEAVITAMNEGDASGLRGRLQYLNLHHFPPGFRVGKAKRADYGMDEVLAFSLWFSLTQASLTPIAATALVIDFWPELARLYMAAARRAGVRIEPVGPSSETIAVITGNALKAAPKSDADDLRGPAAPFDIRSTTREALGKNLGKGFDARIVMDFEAIHETIAAAMAQDPGPVDAAQLHEAIVAFACREGRVALLGDTARPAPSLRKINPDPRGVRLSEADYYYSRAIELLTAIEGRGGKKLAATPRLRRILDYILEPSPREEWKRWMQVGQSDVPFVWAIAALADETTDIRVNIPANLVITAGTRAVEGTNDSLAALLRRTALKASDYELVEADDR